MLRKRKPKWQQQIARERIQILLALAEKFFRKKPERSRRYIELARKIGMRYNVRLTKEQKQKFCKNCKSILIPSFSSEVRLDTKNKCILIKCKNCNIIYRQPYRR
jgi:ribonuclease P protein subunit RPR2